MTILKSSRAAILATAVAAAALAGGAPARADVITLNVSASFTPIFEAACSPTCMLGAIGSARTVVDHDVAAVTSIARTTNLNLSCKEATQLPSGAV
jgi:hypothetical protein